MYARGPLTFTYPTWFFQWHQFRKGTPVHLLLMISALLHRPRRVLLEVKDPKSIQCKSLPSRRQLCFFLRTPSSFRCQEQWQIRKIRSFKFLFRAWTVCSMTEFVKSRCEPPTRTSSVIHNDYVAQRAKYHDSCIRQRLYSDPRYRSWCAYPQPESRLVVKPRTACLCYVTPFSRKVTHLLYNASVPWAYWKLSELPLFLLLFKSVPLLLFPWTQVHSFINYSEVRLRQLACTNTQPPIALCVFFYSARIVVSDATMG